MEYNITQSQKNDIECIKWFIPSIVFKNIIITDLDINKFLDYSERGKNKELIGDYKIDGFNALIQGKRWRGIHIHELYEQGILDGTIPYFTLLGGFCGGKRKWYNLRRYFVGKFKHDLIPRVVVNFLKKEMFKGKDAELIENCYQELIS